MQTWLLSWSPETKAFEASPEASQADVVLYFGAREALANNSVFQSLRAAFPNSRLLGCSTGTAISDKDLLDDSVSAIAIKMHRSDVRLVSVSLDGYSSFEAGRRIGAQLRGPRLAGAIILSDGLAVNGSTLIAGIQDALGTNIPIGGGMAGDGAAFSRTLVGADHPPAPNVVAALGFYGDDLRIGLGASHGWEFFGPTRRVTRSKGAVLFEMDDKPALDLYKRYLGEEAADLPASALLYPLMLTNPSNPADEVVRTVLAVNHEDRSMTFAGNIPEGWSARLMRGAFDNLICGAADAARKAGGDGDMGPGLALLVSCVGRRLLMGQRTADEVEAAANVLSAQFGKIGFYSYGEFAAQADQRSCSLHNQTMTIMTLQEAA